MTDEKALFAALTRNSSDPLNRFAYADWLEENGKLEDREPLSKSFYGHFAWVSGGLEATAWGHPSVLPWLLFVLLKNYEDFGTGTLFYATRDDALNALREAAKALRTPPV